MEVATTLTATMLASIQRAMDGYNAPVVDNLPEFLALFYTLAFTAVICACAFKDARRTHLD